MINPPHLPSCLVPVGFISFFSSFFSFFFRDLSSRGSFDHPVSTASRSFLGRFHQRGFRGQWRQYLEARHGSRQLVRTGGCAGDSRRPTACFSRPPAILICSRSTWTGRSRPDGSTTPTTTRTAPLLILNPPASTSDGPTQVGVPQAGPSVRGATHHPGTSARCDSATTPRENNGGSGPGYHNSWRGARNGPIARDHAYVHFTPPTHVADVPMPLAEQYRRDPPIRRYQNATRQETITDSRFMAKLIEQCWRGEPPQNHNDRLQHQHMRRLLGDLPRQYHPRAESTSSY